MEGVSRPVSALQTDAIPLSPSPPEERLVSRRNPLASVRFSFFKLLGLLFLLLTLFIAWRTRRDIASGETQWGRALFHRSTPLRRAESPLRYWLATLLNVVVVLLFALAAVFILRVGVLRLAGR